MAFTPEASRVPTSIGNINVVLFDNGTSQSAKITLDVLDQDGDLIQHIGPANLAPHITQAQIDGLMDFMDAIRLQVETEKLP